jgi:rsbT co-antagonist protein RsbR
LAQEETTVNDQGSALPTLLNQRRETLLTEWQRRLMTSAALQSGKVKETELRENSARLLDAIQGAIKNGNLADIATVEWTTVRQILEDLSRSWAVNGFTPTETATFVFSLKEPIFSLLRDALAKNPLGLADETWHASLLIDQLGLYSLEHFARTREEVIRRQQHELLELSTPVVELWHGVLALPLIGTLDSQRTQTVMESLLQAIVDTGAAIAIIDITGVPTVDTLVAQHLIKTVSAARLMGADCIISGIRPQIAQTIVHLGLELNVVSKATMADAFKLALRRTGQSVHQSNGAAPPGTRLDGQRDNGADDRTEGRR